MSMNRQARRMAQREGLVNEEGAPVKQRREQPQQRHSEERSSPGEFIKEVRGELRKVAWPSRAEVINYSFVVLTLVVVLTAVVAVLDYGFGEAILKLFDRG